MVREPVFSASHWPGVVPGDQLVILMGSLSPTAVFMLAGSKASLSFYAPYFLMNPEIGSKTTAQKGDAALYIAHLWLLVGIFSKNGNIRSAILQELQLGDLSTSTAKDSIRWRRSIVLG